ncbi:MAG: hypothetical protein ACPF95_00195 [Flavobacteriaceae bacterium]
MATTIKCSKCAKLNSIEARYCSQCGYELVMEKIIEDVESKTFNKKEKKKKSLLPRIIGAVAFAVSFIAAQQYFSKTNFIDKALMEVSSEINENCPFMVDNQTRLDNTSALPDKVFRYNYNLVHLEKNEVDINELKEYLMPNNINDVTTNPDMKDFRENDVTMAYSCEDKNSIFLFKISVTPDMYK